MGPRPALLHDLRGAALVALRGAANRPWLSPSTVSAPPARHCGVRDAKCWVRGEGRAAGRGGGAADGVGVVCGARVRLQPNTCLQYNLST